jgi:2-methylcitrate dehydratase PrpD
VTVGSDIGADVGHNLAEAVATYAVATSFDVIPEEAREQTKKIICDEMLSAHFGRRSLAGELTARYVAGLGGPPEAEILGSGRRAPAPMAALANGTAGHGEELDGAHVVGGHPGATIVHAAVAGAERGQATGAELLNAVVLGYDVGVRVVEACGGLFGVKYRFRLHSDFLFAVGASAAVGRLMRLESRQHRYAMALATFQSNALGALFDERRHMSKSFANGQAAYAGVSAALMADLGLEGSEDVLGAPYGVLEAWGAEGGEDAVTRDLGHDFAVMGANFKLVNAGYPIHAPVEAALTLVAENEIEIADIATVHVGMALNALRIVDDREMHDICLQDMLTTALLRGGLSLAESYFPEILEEPAFAEMRARITAGVDEAMDAERPDGRGARVTIVTRDGQSVSMRIDDPRGHSRRGGVTWSDLEGKWTGTFSKAQLDRILTIAQKLERVDVEDLVAAFR